jgi:hypothetical protein
MSSVNISDAMITRLTDLPTIQEEYERNEKIQTDPVEQKINQLVEPYKIGGRSRQSRILTAKKNKKTKSRSRSRSKSRAKSRSKSKRR